MVVLLVFVGFGLGTDLSPSELKLFRKTHLATLLVWGLWWPGMIRPSLPTSLRHGDTVELLEKVEERKGPDAGPSALAVGIGQLARPALVTLFTGLAPPR